MQSYLSITHFLSDFSFLYLVGIFCIFAMLRKVCSTLEMTYERYWLKIFFWFGFFWPLILPKVCPGSCVKRFGFMFSKIQPHRLFNKQLCTVGLKHHLYHAELPYVLAPSSAVSVLSLYLSAYSCSSQILLRANKRRPRAAGRSLERTGSPGWKPGSRNWSTSSCWVLEGVQTPCLLHEVRRENFIGLYKTLRRHMETPDGL